MTVLVFELPSSRFSSLNCREHFWFSRIEIVEVIKCFQCFTIMKAARLMGQSFTSWLVKNIILIKANRHFSRLQWVYKIENLATWVSKVHINQQKSITFTLILVSILTLEKYCFYKRLLLLNSTYNFSISNIKQLDMFRAKNKK